MLDADGKHVSFPPNVLLGPAVASALEGGKPVVALETAVVTHGLPAPSNMEAILAMQHEVEEAGATPAVCLVEGGRLWIGAQEAQIRAVALDPCTVKASVRDLGPVMARGASAGMTVSATLLAADIAGIAVFATGGIGGVHLGESADVSADLHQLAQRRVVTVCSGAKSVLDIPRTLEYLETFGVPVFTYGSSMFPAFYLHSSGCPSQRLDSPTEVAQVVRQHWALRPETGVVVANPLAEPESLTSGEWKDWLGRARREADRERVQGKNVTPYLLARVAEYSHGRTVRANLALLISNAQLAGQIAVALTA